MINLILGAILGAVGFGLVLKNNKKVTDWFFKTTDWIEVIIETETGKDI